MCTCRDRPFRGWGDTDFPSLELLNYYTWGLGLNTEPEELPVATNDPVLHVILAVGVALILKMIFYRLLLFRLSYKFRIKLWRYICMYMYCHIIYLMLSVHACTRVYA
jgi:hypothetical protein